MAKRGKTKDGWHKLGNFMVYVDEDGYVNRGVAVDRNGNTTRAVSIYEPNPRKYGGGLSKVSWVKFSTLKSGFYAGRYTLR